MNSLKQYSCVILLLFCFLVIGNSLSAQVPEGTKMILVRAFEGANLTINQIVVSYGNGKSEEVELETYVKKNIPENLDRLNTVFSRIEDQGFELITSNAIAYLNGQLMSTYVFRKVKK